MSDMERSTLFFSLSLLLWEQEFRFMAGVTCILAVLLCVQGVAKAWGIPL